MGKYQMIYLYKDETSRNFLEEMGFITTDDLQTADEIWILQKYVKAPEPVAAEVKAVETLAKNRGIPVYHYPHLADLQKRIREPHGLDIRKERIHDQAYEL